MSEASSPQYRARASEIVVDPAVIARGNELARERLRNLRMSTITDIVICLCAIGITACIIWWVVAKPARIPM